MSRNHNGKIADEIGRIIFYRGNFLGRGRFATVFRGKYEDVLDVAVKRLERRSARIDNAPLNQVGFHQNVLRLHGTEDNNDVEYIYVAMELCASTLQDLVMGQYRGPPVGDAKQISSQIIKGLEYLHQKRIPHGDLHPQNILVSYPGRRIPPLMKLSDYWIRRVPTAPRDAEVPLRLFQVAGTRGWMAPEMYTQQRFAFFMDIFALGCIMTYIFCEGKHPFGEDEEKRHFIMKAGGQIAPQVERELQSILPALFELINSMLNIDPAKRPSALIVKKHPFFHQMMAKPTRPPPSVISNVSSSSGGSCAKKKKLDESSDSSSDDSSSDSSDSDSKGGKIHPVVIKKIDVKETLDLSESSSSDEGSVYCLDDDEVAASGDSDVAVDTRSLSSASSSSDDNLGDDIGGRNVEKEEELLELCARRNLEAQEDEERLRKLALDTKVCINCIENNGRTPLLLLCLNNNGRNLLQCVGIILQRGDVNVKVRDRDGDNALFLLCQCYNGDQLEAIARLLIQRGIRVNAKLGGGWNALMFLVGFNRSNKIVDVVRLFIEHKMDINARNNDGDTALGILRKRDNVTRKEEIIQLLLDHDAIYD